MRLHRLHLLNFRQHADTELGFEAGLTGIVGPNGAGKSTILEAIAWALYGNPAVRGTKETIRFARAGARARVAVELEFSLAGHRYRVVRGLTTAEVWLDDAPAPVAESVRAVNEYLQRRLRMTRQEFFHTYFTGQKELDVMAALGPTDRARFLARVLGYDRLTVAQELVREARKETEVSMRALEASLPDEASVRARLDAARAAFDAATASVTRTTAAYAEAAGALAEAEPRWREAEAAREARRALDEEWRAVQRDAGGIAEERRRLAGERASVADAASELVPIEAAIAPLAEAPARLAALETLAGARAERQALEARRTSFDEQIAAGAERLAKLAQAPALDEAQRATIERLRTALTEATVALDEARTRHARDRQEAETRLEAMRTQYQELQEQQRTLEGLGAETPCPTCGRPLGANHRAVLDDVVARLDTLAADGQYFRQRAEQLREPPAALRELEAARTAAQEELAAAERRLARIQAGVQEREQLLAQQATLESRREETVRALAALPTGYDAAAHEAARADAARLATLETQRARLRALAERAEGLAARDAELAAREEALASRRVELEAARDAAPVDEARFAELRATYERASEGARRAELAAVEAQGELVRATAERDEAARQAAERERQAARLRTLETARAEHAELDRAFAELRTDLNAQLRPELAAIASDFLRALTDGRYTELELDEQYAVRVLDDGVPKPVLSGGEEDLCNLVLRLAISQMIAERAGQAFSLLVLDEVFGSLDETRRGNVVELLRRLQDRFEQVVVITHIDDVREGLDRVLVVRYDEAAGTSRVHREEGGVRGTPDGDDPGDADGAAGGDGVTSGATEAAA